ncbi:MAG: ABC transporter substrate-binding protein [Deltaproteobacteria bacterium]|nr:ABC transporter substrate-binding protein [Deltaproteobacteria bacterium]
MRRFWFCVTIFSLVFLSQLPAARAADKLIGIHSARVMSQSMPWIAQEAGLFKKYNVDFPLVYIASSPAVTAAMLGGDAEIALTGGEGMIRAYVQGATDFVFIAGVKNILTHSILARTDIKKPADLRGKKIGINRIGSNPHYLAVQALRRYGLEAKDVQFIQSGGAPETLAALVSGALDAASLTSPGDFQALAQGFHYVIYGPDLRVPYAATEFVSRRPVLAKRSPAIGQFLRVMAEAAKILHTDKEQTFKVLGKYLRLTDRKILEAAYASEIKALEPRMAINPEGFQAVLEEVAKVDPRSKKVKPEDLIDTRYLDELEKSGFMEKLWGGKS